MCFVHAMPADADDNTPALTYNGANDQEQNY